MSSKKLSKNSGELESKRLLREENENLKVFFPKSGKIKIEDILRRHQIQKNRLDKESEVICDKDSSKISINIVTWADVDMMTGMCWGDYWVKKRFEYHLKKLGFQVNVLPDIADISIYLWGSPMPIKGKFPFLYNPKSYNIAWAYSHPQRLDYFEIKKYDRIYSLSEFGVEKFSKLSNNVCKEPLIGCSDFIECKEEEKIDNDIIFIGNARGRYAYGRKIIRDLDKELNLTMYGHKWPNKTGYNPQWYKGQYFDYDELNKLYGGAKISLNDHQEDMAPWNYVSIRIFDILASRGFCISDFNPGVKGIFGDSVPMFKNREDLNKLIRIFLEDKKARKELSSKGKEIASKHRYIDRVKTILNNEKISF